MKRLLFLLFFLPIFSFGQNQVPPSTKSVGDYDQTIRARDTLFTDYHFVYRDTVIPVLDISYHEFSADSINWHKPWVAGDIYIRISNDVKNTWKVLNILSLSDPLWARDSIGGIYNFANDYDVHVMNDLNVEDSINTNNFYFLDGDSLKITWLNATDGSTGDILQNINGVAYWMPITSVFDSAGFYDAQNNNIGGVGVWDVTSENVFYFRGIDGSDCITAILDDATNRIVIAFDPTCLSVTAGIGLSGGGTFDASGNVIVNLSIPELTTATSYDSLDWFAMYDVSLASHRKVHISAITGGTPSNDSVFWIAANDGSIDTIFNNSVLFFEEGDTTINIEVSGDSVIFSVNGCPVPPGGLAGQVLVKLSDADCDLAWVNFCDLIQICDTQNVVAEMCDFAAPYIESIVPTTGYLNVGALVSANETIGDYVIDWYLNGSINFTSATADAGVTNYVLQPFNIPVAGGTYTPVIRWVEINGLRYTSYPDQPGTYSPDLLDCLTDIVAADYTCSNGAGYTVGAASYEHLVSYSYELATAELPTREITMNLDLTTDYIPWYFSAENVVDTIKVYFVHGTTETLIETWQVGLYNGSHNFPVHNVYSTYFNKITSLTDFTVALGDKIKFEIAPSGLNTDWALYWKCLDTLDFDLCTPFAKDYQTIDTTATIAMSWNETSGTYDLTYSNKAAHVFNDVQRYIYETYDWATNMTYVPASNRWGKDFKISLNRNVSCGWLETPSYGTGCSTFTDSITYKKSSDTVELIARNSTDYALFKNYMTLALASSRVTDYSPDPENIDHYKMVMFSASSQAVCGDGVVTSYPKMYTHYDKTNISYDDANFTVQVLLQKTVDGYTDSIKNTCGTAPSSTDVPLTTAFYNLPDFTNTFKVGSWTISDGAYDRSVNTDDSISAYVSYRGRYANYQNGMHEEILDLCPTYDYVKLSASRHYFYPTYMQVVITLDDPGDPLVATQNFDVYNCLDVNGYKIADPANYRLVYRMLNGVGTWYSTGL